MKNMKALWFNCNIMGLGLLILLLFSLKTALAGTIVKSLPGYGDLPFTLETGYVGVGENEELQLFYYFVESESSPEKDPLMLWIPEGPGCTSLAPFFFGKGPLRLDTINYTEGLLPNLLPNPFAWTQGLNIIFLDAPVGTGFSYSKTSEGYNNVGDFSFANQTYEFLLKWLQNHTEFSKNQLYVAGEGYAGNIVPLVIDKILNGNQDMNIKGYVLGNPGTDKITDFNAQTTIAYRLGLVPERLYQEAYKSCGTGNFTMENPSANCTAYNDIITQLISGINMPNILQPTCSDLSTLTSKEQTDDYSTRRHLKQESIDFQADAQEKQSVVNPALSCVSEPSCRSLFTLTLKEQTDDNSTGRHLKERSRDFLNLQANAQETQCASYTQMVCEKWANDTDVQEALHVEKGTITFWSYCSNNPNYTTDVTTVINYHRNFTMIDLQALIYSGDHDMAISYIGTEEWIWTLDLPLVESWSPWSIDNEVAGFTRRFTNDSGYNLTFATVKGAGHFAAQDKPRECFKMVQRWRGYSQMVYEIWANNKSVQEALHVLKDTNTSWMYCNHSNLYVNNVKNVVGYHRHFTTTNLQALIYSGDHDISIPCIGTLEWIQKLGLQSIEDWCPWSVENEVAGYTLRLTNKSRYNLTFATVKGAGHYAVQDKPRECSEMFKSWMVNGTLSVDLP